MEYTKLEQQKIKKTMDTLIADLDEIWSLGLIEEIKIPIDLPGIENIDENYRATGWYFYMDDDGIYIENSINDESYVHARRNRNGKLKGCYDTIDEREILFFKEYEKIRCEIMKKVTQIQTEKQSKIDLMDNLMRKFSGEATVEINLPNSNNQHELKVKEENGRTIGILDFGPASVKIITDGSIKLVNTSLEKTKAKQK